MQLTDGGPTGGHGLDLLSPAEVLGVLSRTLASPEFLSSPRMGAFLKFLVEERLAGRERSLKELNIAMSVFGKNSSFDPGSNAIVRVEAGRLRRLLADFSRGSGIDERHFLEIPKGTYVPFLRRASTPGRLHSSLSCAPQLPGRHHVTVIACRLPRSISNKSIDSGRIHDDFLVFRRIFTRVTEKFGGKVAEEAGDRFVGYFGWPRSLENAAYLAVAAARELVLGEIEPAKDDSVAGLEQTPADVAIKVGVATGWAISGARNTDSATSVPSLLGDVLDDATAISYCASAGGVFLSEATYRILRHYCRVDSPCNCLALGESVWRLGELGIPFDPNEDVPLVGRRHELDLLFGRWSRVEAKEGQIVVVSGEPGIGKSRLINDLWASIRQNGGQRMLLRALPLYSRSALSPVRDVISELAGIMRADGGEQINAKLLSLATTVGESEAPGIALLGSLFGLMLPDALQDMPASRRKETTFAMLVRLIFTAAHKAPLLLVVEDVHWLDPSTTELIHLIARSLQAQPIMLAVTSRPGDDQWRSLPRATVLELAPLGKADVEQMIDEVAGSEKLSAEQRKLVIEKTEGIPLFVEEFAKTLCDTPEFGGPLPERLIDLLMARLDRLGDKIFVAQVAAAIGREFRSDVLATVAELPEDALGESMRTLVEEGVILPGGEGGTGTGCFRHILFRDAAYESMLLEQRRPIHERIARLLAGQTGFERRAEIIADHLVKAGLTEESAPWWLEAGKRAAKDFANEEAISHFRAGLAALKGPALTAASKRHRLELLTELGVVLRITEGYGAPELLPIYEEAKTLCAQIHSPDQEGATFAGLWAYFCARGDWVESRTIAAEVAQRAKEARHRGLLLEARRLFGTSALFQGRLSEAILWYDKVLRRYDLVRYKPSYGYDTGAAAAVYSAWALFLQGDEKAALMRADLAWSIALSQKHAPTQAIVLGWRSVLDILRSGTKEGREHGALLRELSEKHGFNNWSPLAQLVLAWSETMTGLRPFDYVAMSQSITEFCVGWGGFLSPFLWMTVSQCCEVGNRNDLALRALIQAEEFVKCHSEHIWDAEILRRRGELVLKGDSADRKTLAAGYFSQAVALAVSQGSAIFEQRAQTSLANLKSPSGRV
ncbi:ATP-binding protein [Paraburkholderia fungorum]|uniref:ATP-binding protein n=1 Tax=Paraburkholderia fungorum TaxID=134537 RepID=UPI0038B823DD